MLANPYLPRSHVEIRAVAFVQLVGRRLPRLQRRDNKLGVLSYRERVGVLVGHECQESVQSFLFVNAAVLHRRRKTALPWSYPYLKESHRNVLAVIDLLVEHPLANCGVLNITFVEHAALAVLIGVLKLAIQTVGDNLDVLMRMHRPYASWDQRVHIVDAQSPEV